VLSWRRRTPRRQLLTRPVVLAVLALIGVFLCWFAWSMGAALTAPGTDSVASRVAEWARNHYLGPLVTLGERVRYQPPKVGGEPSIALTAPGSRPPAGGPGSRGLAAAAADVPPRLVSPAGPPLPGEGSWRVLATVRGAPAAYSAYVRPDATHTSYVAAAVSMDQRLVRFQLHPGLGDPGPAHWRVPPTIRAGARSGLLATFNGGFKIDASGGGFYLNGLTRGTLTNGAASLVFYRDGRVDVGVWGRDLRMTAQVVGIRQNLRPIVDHGVVPKTVDTNIESGWGKTLGGGYYVWRSGVGMTRDGRLVYVYGPALSVRTLADLLQRAGCVEAMQLDINPEWMSFMYYRPGHHPADPTPLNLLPGQQQPAGRYYEPSSRDFTAVYAR
jgi:Phosphodiester glycosidase